MSVLTEEKIQKANDDEVRRLMEFRFRVVGSLANMLTEAEMMMRIPKIQDRRLTSHPLIGEYMADDTAGIEMTICDMVTKQSADMELSGGSIDLELNWLQVESDKNKYFIVLIIRRFLTMQNEVHEFNMSKPTDIEERDYRIMRQIHNHLVDDAQHWINRVGYEIQEKVQLDSLESIMNCTAWGGVEDVKEGKRTETKQLGKFDIGTSLEFSRLNDSASKW